MRLRRKGYLSPESLSYEIRSLCGFLFRRSRDNDARSAEIFDFVELHAQRVNKRSGFESVGMALFFLPLPTLSLSCFHFPLTTIFFSCNQGLFFPLLPKTHLNDPYVSCDTTHAPLHNPQSPRALS